MNTSLAAFSALPCLPKDPQHREYLKRAVADLIGSGVIAASPYQDLVWIDGKGLFDLGDI